jgi:hypothetical protein|tara:strand:+ start:819 stop:2222 length:1404 start_codon:yes stop_codon:yes gene_type:complete
MATYGGRNDENTFNVPKLKGDTSGFYSITDAKTGQTKLYRKQPGGGLFGDAEVGSYEPGGKFTPGKDFKDVFDKEGQKEFLTKDVQKGVRDQINETVVRAQKAAGVEEIVARKRAQELLETGEQTTPTDADPQTVINDTNNQLSDLNIPVKTGTRKGPGSFSGPGGNDLRYPLSQSGEQDYISFTMLEYKAKKVAANNFGFGARTRVGPDGQAEGRTRLGAVILPIPGGIKDENGAEWGPGEMNAFQILGSDLARSMTGASGDSVDQTIQNMKDTIGNNSPELQKALEEGFASKAVGQGFGGLLSRTRGAVFNPNLELLFNKPTLRPFDFTFDLAARSKDEADMIVRIIRFFKQGSAPIRSESNLFLLAPHTFQVHYVLAGDKNDEHPFIGKMKECAITRVAVDYTPQQNYSTLKGGYMTQYRLTLQMTELEPVFNDDYNDDKFASFREDPAEQAALNNTLPARIGF